LHGLQRESFKLGILFPVHRNTRHLGQVISILQMDWFSLRVSILRIAQPSHLAMPKQRAAQRIGEVLEIDLPYAALSGDEPWGDAKQYPESEGAHQRVTPGACPRQSPMS
ncbi:MAG: hypothetical protein WBM14_11610, partial [Terracidiphilus sp.]